MAGQDLNLHPDSPERAASAKRTSTCRTCAQRGIFQVAHRILRDGSGQFGICNWHFRGDKHPEELKAKAPAKTGGDGAGRTPAYQAGASGPTPDPRSNNSSETRKGKEEVTMSLHSSNGAMAMVALPEAKLDAWWASLSVGRKGEILAAAFFAQE